MQNTLIEKSTNIQISKYYQSQLVEFSDIMNSYQLYFNSLTGYTIYSISFDKFVFLDRQDLEYGDVIRKPILLTNPTDKSNLEELCDIIEISMRSCNDIYNTKLTDVITLFNDNIETKSFYDNYAILLSTLIFPILEIIRTIELYKKFSGEKDDVRFTHAIQLINSAAICNLDPTRYSETNSKFFKSLGRLDGAYSTMGILRRHLNFNDTNHLHVNSHAIRDIFADIFEDLGLVWGFGAEFSELSLKDSYNLINGTRNSLSEDFFTIIERCDHTRKRALLWLADFDGQSTPGP